MHAWVFDHSSCHAAMAPDALDVGEMNVKPGGKQQIMHDTIYQGRIQKMTFRDGTAKGMRQVLQERGVDTSGMVAEQMKAVLATHPDFCDEKSEIEKNSDQGGPHPNLSTKVSPRAKSNREGVGSPQEVHKGSLQILIAITEKEHPPIV